VCFAGDQSPFQKLDLLPSSGEKMEDTYLVQPVRNSLNKSTLQEFLTGTYSVNRSSSQNNMLEKTIMMMDSVQNNSKVY
jgi:hypothetical protein